MTAIRRCERKRVANQQVIPSQVKFHRSTPDRMHLIELIESKQKQRIKTFDFDELWNRSVLAGFLNFHQIKLSWIRFDYYEYIAAQLIGSKTTANQTTIQFINLFKPINIATGCSVCWFCSSSKAVPDYELFYRTEFIDNLRSNEKRIGQNKNKQIRSEVKS